MARVRSGPLDARRIAAAVLPLELDRLRHLHMAVVVRTRMDPATKAYVERRLTEGHTKKEIRRCLKRYLARQIYRTLTAVTRADEALAAVTSATPIPA